MSKKLMAILLTLAMVLTFAACGGSSSSTPASSGAVSSEAEKTADPIVLKAACTQNSTDNMAIYLKSFCDAVTERTDGAITFEFYPNGELGTLAEVREMVISGANIVLSEGADSLAAHAPDLGVLNAPYSFTDFSQIEELLNSDWYDEQVALLQNAGIQVLALNWMAGQRCLIGNTAVKGPSDLNGKIIRCPGNTVFTAFCTRFGASPTTSNWNEVYTGLSNKVFDLAEANIALLYNSSLYEVADYLNLSYHNFMNTGLIMSTSIFDQLTDEQKQIMMDAAYEFGGQYKDISVSAEKQAVEDFRATGQIEIIETDTQAMFDYGAGMYDNLGEWSDEVVKLMASITG